MDIRFVNHNGNEVDLMSGVYKIEESSLFSHSWNYDSDDAASGYGGKIKKFRKGVQNREINIHIEGVGMESYKQAYDHIMEIFDEDIIDETAGKLYIDDFYMRCFITDGEPVYFVPGLDMCTYKFKLASEYPFWIHEESRSFPPISSGSEGEESYLDYEHDYPYDYTMPYGGDVIWNVDHYAPCEFLMTVFGPAVDPRVVINGHPYQIYTTLDANEYLQIDSRANTVVKYLANGIRQDIYDLRAKQESVFDPIAPGNISVVWSGEFGFDVTLYCERSEPRWKTQNS